VTDAAILWFSVRMAALATALLIPPGLALAWLLARGRWRGKSVVETLVALPLVMPPVATGLILLKLVPRDFIFTWKAVVTAMIVMSSPFVIRAARVAFEEVSPRYEQIARTLGAGEWRVFFTITMPLALRGIAGGVLLAFSRALGEFGATVLVAGNIPGRTQTLAMAIYERVQIGHDRQAWSLVAAGVVIAFAAVWLNERLTRQR
jgi:molybdate transport system permease protein